MRASITIAIVVSLAGGMLGFSPANAADKQRTFATPEEAITDFVAAVKADDEKALIAILGPKGEPLVHSGDEVADKAAGERFVQSYEEAHKLVKSEDGDEAFLDTGKDDWPFPIPLVKEKDGWRFDTEEGKEELLSRRIGRNELATIEACRAYVDAQREYYATSHDGDPLLQYAQKLGSTPGKHDGLYWETAEGEPPSPLGPLITGARSEGYKDAAKGKGAPYHGYYYRTLTAQGSHAAGGAYSYLANGKMIGGFALVAYPAEWANSGVMTFIVNQDGVVYQKDLGPKTASLAPAMKNYDPDDTWTQVEGDGEVAAGEKAAAPESPPTDAK